jgi:hypothetical protein
MLGEIPDKLIRVVNCLDRVKIDAIENRHER